jgi:hypothetical protein
VVKQFFLINLNGKHRCLTGGHRDSKENRWGEW